MFPKYNGFYLTGLFEVLCEIWHIYYMYPFDVIVAKNGAKSVYCILHVKIASKLFNLLEIA